MRQTSSEASSSSIAVDRHRVVMNRSIAGCAAKIVVPTAAYSGVAVRMEPFGTEGDLRVVLELAHADPDLVVTLGVADDPSKVAEAWLAWGKALGLPLLVIASDGTVHRREGFLQQRAEGASGSQAPFRRSSAVLRGRRSRVSRKRKPGDDRRDDRLPVDEIIARS